MVVVTRLLNGNKETDNSKGTNGYSGVKTGNSIPSTSLPFHICTPVSAKISNNLSRSSLGKYDWSQYEISLFIYLKTSRFIMLNVIKYYGLQK